MRITIMTRGTRGDVEPFLALARGLLSRGHQVTVATGVEFEPDVRRLDIPYRPIEVRFLEAMKSADGRASRDGDRNAAERLRKEVYDPATRRIIADLWRAAQGAEGIICNHALYYARHIAERLNVPLLYATCSPFLSPTRAFPFMFLTNRDRGAWLNRLSYLAIYQLALKDHRSVDAACREVLGTGAGWRFSNILRSRGRRIPILYYFSPSLLAAPSDWDRSAHITGYWHLQRAQTWRAPRALEQFLEEGPPPIYVGFGSMVTSRQADLSALVTAALERSGQRAVLCSGEGGIADPGLDSVYYTDYIPFDWLFPRVRAVVHHGGAGVVNLGVRYGKPTVICPLIADQAFWARVLHRHRIAPAPFELRYDGLTPAALAAAIKQVVDDDTMRANARRMGERMRVEDGVGEAAGLIEKYIGSGHGARGGARRASVNAGIARY